MTFATAVCAVVNLAAAEWSEVSFRPRADYAASFTYAVVSNQSGGVVNFNTSGYLLNSPGSARMRAGGTNRFLRIFRFCGAEAPRVERPHFGSWRMTGPVTFAEPAVTPVRPVYAAYGETELGAGERIIGNRYWFATDFPGRASTADRAFEDAVDGYFHDPRWRMRAGGAVRYRHSLGGRSFRSAELEASVDDAPGGWSIEVRTGGGEWRSVAVFPKGQLGRVKVPAELLPAKELGVRITGVGGKGFVLSRYAFAADVDGAPVHALGRTEWRVVDSDRAVEFPGLAEIPQVRGGLLPGDRSDLRLWTCESGWKVMKETPAPVERTPAVSLAAAANETEAAQFVLRPERTMSAPRWQVSELKGPKDQTIRAEQVEVLRVGYVPVSVPTDASCRTGWWPDPLFRTEDAPEELTAGENQPYWVRVKVPKGTAAGVYRGTVSGAGLTIPVHLRVFGFELPDRMTCETAFALRHYQLVRYQQPGAHAKEVVDRYLRCLADHHLAAYDPDPSVPLRCTWENPEDPAKARPVFNWTEWDAKIERSFRELNYVSIDLPQLGTIGGGTYQGRWPGRILKWKTGDSAYDLLFDRFWGEIDRHLAEKGWAEKSYVYWFDEPEQKDLAFVADGFRRLKRAAPHIRRMITCGCRRELMDDVNLWCPLTPSLHEACAAEARRRGDTFWWYVCCNPKAPYATEFIDKPGTEMRVWLWQTWGEGVTGILLWNTIYWTSESMYGGGLTQNPYLDPQSWDDGHPVPWGNGDGRLLYPPRECFAANGLYRRPASPVLSGPVESYRLEMVRDGLEDYEYFAMLRRLDADNPLLRVPADVSSSLTVFTREPEPMTRHRLRLAQEIERLKPGKP